MMPELGKYATEVLSSYVISLGLLVVLIGRSVARARKVSRQLDEIEERVKNG
jgi:heme exporter protein D